MRFSHLVSLVPIGDCCVEVSQIRADKHWQRKETWGKKSLLQSLNQVFDTFDQLLPQILLRFRRSMSSLVMMFCIFLHAFFAFLCV